MSMLCVYGMNYTLILTTRSNSKASVILISMVCFTYQALYFSLNVKGMLNTK